MTAVSSAVKFSVVTVTYNNHSGLSETAKNVLGQDFGDYEWIVIDGGSTDGTSAFLNGLEDSNIKWISEPDKGIFDAMNKGIRLAVGEYCIFMNAGDLFANPSVLRDVAEAIGTERPTLVYGDACEFAGSQIWKKPARSTRANVYVMFTHHQAIFYRRDALEAGYDLSYKFSADWALTVRILRAPNVSVLKYSGDVCHFERGGVSQGDAHRSEINLEHWRIYRQESEMGLMLAALLWFAKTSTNKVRRYFPRVYDRLRYS
ncbi:glycosyltransferase family 2 protein [Bradyrhizobium sp. CW10]|uniref:glycosyltransferase family 2 protein n=1 Tax=Bradyrhizobium sp. CW10 TaxID=2782683 RepID=UPI001FF89A56|nr:glycosyltransferase family 2 protein [Bradyrhizobium sp. CW10]MCK1468415.1 glycosyltransferase [Bradyrhizobium sp. CW10]